MNEWRLLKSHLETRNQLMSWIVFWLHLSGINTIILTRLTLQDSNSVTVIKTRRSTRKHNIISKRNSTVSVRWKWIIKQWKKRVSTCVHLYLCVHSSTCPLPKRPWVSTCVMTFSRPRSICKYSTTSAATRCSGHHAPPPISRRILPQNVPVTKLI